MIKFLLRWIINAVALYAAVLVIKNVNPNGINLQLEGWQTYVWAGLIFGLVNALLRPVLSLLTCPLIILTLGLFTFIINTFLFYVVGWIGNLFGVGYTLSSFWYALLGAVVVSLVSFVLSLVIKDERRDRPRRKDNR
jgi:putative membrane protein